MKRGILGAALLAVLLFAGILSSRSLGNTFMPMEETLQQAALAAQEEDWQTAEDLTRQVFRQWERSRFLTAVLTDHGPLEQIDALFARLEVYGRAGNATAYAALCARLAQELSDLGIEQILSWQNLL